MPDEKVTQANAWRLLTELSDEDSRLWHEAEAAGRGKIRFPTHGVHPMTDATPSPAPSAVPDAVLAELARLCEAASAGPWKWDGDNGTMEGPWDKAAGRPAVVFANTGRGRDDPTIDDGELIAAARNALPAILSELAARRAADAGRGGP